MLTSYFCFPSRGDALDAVCDARNVLCMVNAFLGARDPLDMFVQNEEAVSGLFVILQSAANSLGVAQNELRAQIHEMRDQVGPTTKTSSEAEGGEDVSAARIAKRVRAILNAASAPLPEKDSEGAHIPASEKPASLTAREAAVLETYRKGYEIEDIAQAVNLKKTSVQRIIARLKATGDIPQDRDGEGQAASA